MPENPPSSSNISSLIEHAFRIKNREALGIDQEEEKNLLNTESSLGVDSPYSDVTRIEGRPEDAQWYKYKDKYENRFGKDLGINQDPYKAIAKNQSFGEQFSRKIGNLLPNIALGIVESIGYLGELPGAITGSDRDFSNGLTEWAKAGRNDVFGEVYQMHPEKTVDISDSAWWLNNGFDLVESIAEFAVPGTGIGKGLGTVAKGISTVAKLGKTGSKILNAAIAQIPTSAALAYTEGAMSGADVYKQVYDDTLARTGNEEYAKEQASNSASTTVALNTGINTLLNLYSVGSMFTNTTKSGLISKRFGFGKVAGESVEDYASRLGTISGEYMPSKMRSFSKYIKEAPMESAEELINVFAEKRGKEGYGTFDTKDWVNDLIEAAKSDEGILSMALGAVGGIGNIAVANNMPSIKKADNKLGYSFGESTRKEELNYNKSIYAAQLNALKSDLDSFFTTKEELQKATDAGDRTGIKEAKEKLFNIGLNRAIVEGNADSMISTLQEIANVDNTKIGEDGKTDAIREGLTESTLDNDYKKIADRKIDKVKRLAEEFKVIEERYTPRELEAPGFIRHISKANVNYLAAQDVLADAIMDHDASLTKLISLKDKLTATAMGIEMVEGVVGYTGDAKDTAKKMSEANKLFNDSKEMKEYEESKKAYDEANKKYLEAKEQYNKATDFEAYKNSLQKAVEDIDNKKDFDNKQEQNTAILKQELDNKFTNAGYARTGKVGESFAFKKGDKTFLGERVMKANKDKVLIKDPSTGKYLTDDKGEPVEFSLDYYKDNKDIAIIPKQQYFQERKEQLIAKSKDAQNKAIESVINDYQEKLKSIAESIPEYEKMIVDLSLELYSLEKDMEKILKKNRTSKLSKKAIKDRIKSINKTIEETDNKIIATRETKLNIERSIAILQDFQTQLQFVPKEEMLSFTQILKDTELVLEKYPIEETQKQLLDIVTTLDGVIASLMLEKKRLQDVVDSLQDLLNTDELFSALVSKNIRVATFLDANPDFPSGLLRDTTKLLDSDLNKLAVINYIKRRAAGQNQPYKVVKQQLVDELYPIAFAELTAQEREKVENDLNVALSDLKEVSGKINEFLKEQKAAKDKFDLREAFDILSKHIEVLSSRYSKELSKNEDNQGVDRSQLAGNETEIVSPSERDEIRATNSFLSDFVFYTTGRNLKFDDKGTIYDDDGNPVFEEGYQQRWFKFLDKHSKDLQPDEDEGSKYSLKVYKRNSKNTPEELNKLMNEEVGDKLSTGQTSIKFDSLSHDLSNVNASNEYNDKIIKRFESSLQEGDKIVTGNNETIYFKNSKIVKKDGKDYGMSNIPSIAILTKGATIYRSKTSTSSDLGIFLVDNKGELVKVDEKGNPETNGIPAFTFLPQINSLLPKDGNPKVTWGALGNLYQINHSVSIPSVKGKANEDMIKFDGKEMTVREFKNILIEEGRIYYKNFLDKLEGAKGEVSLEIGGVTKGIALRKRDKEGKSRTQSLEQLMKSTGTEVEKIYVSMFGKSLVINGISYQFDPGTSLVELSDGNIIPVHTKTLSNQDIDTMLYLISQGTYSFHNKIPLGTFERDGKQEKRFTIGRRDEVRIFPSSRGDKFSLINNITNWGQYNVNAANKKYEIFIKNGYVHFKDVDNGFASIRLSLDEVLDDKKNSKLKKFLSQKKYNIPVSAINSKARYFHPYVKNNKIEFKQYDNFEKFLEDKIITFTFASKDGQITASKNIIIKVNGKGIPIVKETTQPTPEKTTPSNISPEDVEVPEPPVDSVYDADPSAFGAVSWEDIDPAESARNIRDVSGKIISKTEPGIVPPSMKDAILGLNKNTPKGETYGFTKEEWDAMSQEERDKIEEINKDCKNKDDF